MHLVRAGRHLEPARQRAAILAINSAVGTSAGIFAPFIMGSVIETAATPAAGYHQGFFVCGVVAVVGGLIGMVFLRPRPRASALALSAQTSLQRA